MRTGPSGMCCESVAITVGPIADVRLPRLEQEAGRDDGRSLVIEATRRRYGAEPLYPSLLIHLARAR
jgi:hypothetical protein